MTDNVLARQLAEGNSVYFFQYLHCHIKAGACTGWKVLLRGISGYNDFGTETDTGQEHLHLRRCRILCLIKDNKRIVERTASHVRERRNLNQAFFHVFLEALCSHDLIQRIVERPQIRVNFTLQVARQETEFFTRLNRRTRQEIRPTSSFRNAVIAIAIARYVFPVPAGPTPKTIIFSRIASTYAF